MVAFSADRAYDDPGMLSWTPFRSFRAWFPLFLRVALATAPVLAVTGYLYLESRNSERLLLEAETVRQADFALLQFEGFTSARVSAMKDAANFLVAATGGSPEDFGRYLQRLLAEVPYFDSLWQVDLRGNVLQVITAGKPGGGHGAPSSPVFMDTLAKALASRQPAATSSFDLPHGEKGVTMVVPILREGHPEGALAGTIRLDAGIRDMYGADMPSLWNLELADRAARTVYRAIGNEPSAADPVVTRHVPVADRAWKLRLWPTPTLATTLRTAVPQRILLIGLVASLVVAAANFLLAQHGERLAESLRESKRLASDRDAARRRLSELVNGIEAVIWESDAERQRVTFVNAYARKLLGLDAERWAAEPDSWSEHVHPDDRARARENLLAAQHPGQTCDAEYRMYNAERQVIWVREIVTVIGGRSGRMAGRRGVVVDISARVQAEEALRQSQKLESLGVLAGGIAHDFNNLLTTIMGNAEMLRPWLVNGDSKGRSHLDKIERTTRRLAELTRQMLAYSGRGEFTVAETDLNAIVTEMTELLMATTPKNVQVMYRLDPELPTIRADAAQIRQVILNLLTNATEAIGEHRRGEVVVRSAAATLDAEQINEAFAGQDVEPGHYVILEVSDTGSGMSSETLSKIFDPFFTTKFAGRGLGLAALRGIIRSHRGGIRIFSRLGQGTVFTLLFPAVGGHRVPPASDEEDVDAAGLAGATILLVDDEESLRGLMAMALEEAGCTVIQAVDGEDGIRQFRQYQESIDLVVLDLTMPRLNGDEVFRQITDAQPDARVILISGYTQEDVARHFAGQQVTGYLEKPFPPSALVAKVRSVLVEADEHGHPAAPPAPTDRRTKATAAAGVPREITTGRHPPT